MKAVENSHLNEKDYSFNFRRFREFKKKIRSFMINKYGQDIVSKIFQNKEIKEAFYKFILGFPGYKDVFNSGRTKDIKEFNLDPKIMDIVEDIKKYVMDNLYKI